MFDVALDRATELLPPVENNALPSVSWDTDDVHNPPDAADEGQSALEAQPQEDEVEPGALLVISGSSSQVISHGIAYRTLQIT